MQLGQIFQASNAWGRLASMRMRPAVAYKILKYARSVAEEHALAEKQRAAAIHEVTGTQEGQEARIEPDTPEMGEFNKRFMEIMMTESDLQRCQMTLDEILDAVGPDQDDVLSAQDLAALEPFFITEAPAVAGKIE